MNNTLYNNRVPLFVTAITTSNRDLPMTFSQEVITSSHRSVLCWLATASAEGVPNVSPKEIFHVYGTDKIIIANIASPQTVRNIRENPRVCVSFVDILVQKGYQVKGTAALASKSDPDYDMMEEILLRMTGDAFPFASITVITAAEVKPILAPSYLLYPDTTEAEQIEKAKTAYGF